MPQLEQVEFFISQLFWLGVFFVILFTVLTYITLPKIRAFLNQRDDFVKSHISKQDELIKKAESIIENYEAKLTEAKNQASQIINDAKDKALKESEDLIKATDCSAASPTATAIKPSSNETSGSELFLIAFKKAKCS